KSLDECQCAESSYVHVRTNRHPVSGSYGSKADLAAASAHRHLERCGSMSAPPPIFTVGHSTRSIGEFADLLRRGPVELVVDVRTVPHSRHNPQYDEGVLGAELAAYQIAYSRMPALGGLRGRSREVAPEVNAYWENQSFHNYADYALSDEFAVALGDLLQISSAR